MSGDFDAFDEHPQNIEEDGWHFEQTALGLAETLADLDKHIALVPTYTFLTQEQKDALVAELKADAKAMTEQYMKRHDNNGEPKADEAKN